MHARFTAPGTAAPNTAALGTFGVGPKVYGFKPTVPGRKIGLATTPALGGLFRSGRITVGISQINAMATNIMQGSG